MLHASVVTLASFYRTHNVHISMGNRTPSPRTEQALLQTVARFLLDGDRFLLLLCQVVIPKQTIQPP